jgi:hypothetical protein
MADVMQMHRTVTFSSISEPFSVNMTLGLRRTVSTPSPHVKLQVPCSQYQSLCAPWPRVKLHRPLDLKAKLHVPLLNGDLIFISSYMLPCIINTTRYKDFLGLNKVFIPCTEKVVSLSLRSFDTVWNIFCAYLMMPHIPMYPPQGTCTPRSELLILSLNKTLKLVIKL